MARLEIVADASPLIFLAKLHLLEAFLARHHVTTTFEVLIEVMRRPKDGGADIQAAAKAGKLYVRSPSDYQRVHEYNARAGPGEATVVVLAGELRAMMLVDDAKGRSLAVREGVEHFGTLAVLLALHRDGVVKSIPKALDQLARAGFYLTPKLREQVLRSAGPPTVQRG